MGLSCRRTQLRLVGGAGDLVSSILRGPKDRVGLSGIMPWSLALKAGGRPTATSVRDHATGSNAKALARVFCDIASRSNRSYLSRRAAFASRLSHRIKRVRQRNRTFCTTFSTDRRWGRQRRFNAQSPRRGLWLNISHRLLLGNACVRVPCTGAFQADRRQAFARK